MNFLSVLYAKAGITVDGVTTLNNTATGLTPATNDNSTKLATTGYVKNQNYYPYPTGTTAQYVRGDGSLATFTQTGGGGSSVSYYLNGSVSQGTIGGNAYYEMSKNAIIGTNADFSINADGYVAQFVTDAGDPALLSIPGGNWNFEMFFSASSSGGTPSFYVELYKYDGTTLTLISSGSTNPESITSGTATDLYLTSLAVPTTTLTLTDRLAIRVYVTHSGRTITLHTQNGHLCQVITTFTTGLTALNGLTAQVQNFAVGAGGSDFNISSVTDTHTFNLPTASATKRGALSSIDWSAFDAKVDFGDLSATAPLNYNGSGLFTIAQSSASTNGYLSSTDWTTFNNKIGGSGTANYIAKFTSGSVVGNSIIYDDGTNVGIGTNSPQVELALYNTATPRFHLQNSTSGISSVRGFQLALSGTATYLWNFENGSTIFGTNNTERMRITDGGNIGINITNPSSKLHISTTASNPFRMVRTGGSATDFGFEIGSGDVGFYNYSSSTYGWYLTSASRFGLGTTNPFTKLEVYGGHDDTKARLYSTGNGASLDASLDMWASEPGVSYDGSGIGNNVNGSPFYGRRNSSLGQSYIRFYLGEIILYTGATNANIALTINTSGAATFSSSVTAKGDLIIWGGNAAQSGFITANSAGGGLYIAASGTNQNIRLVPSGTGFVQVIGALDVSSSVTAVGALFTSSTETRGTIRTTFTGDNSYYSLFSNDGALTLDTYGVGGSIYLKILGSTKLIIAASGNLLLGTVTEAGYKLDVNGTAIVRGRISTIGGSSNDVYTQYTTIADITNTNDYVLRFNNNAGSQIGYIGIISSGGVFQYNNSNGHNFTGAATFSSSVNATSFTANNRTILTSGGVYDNATNGNNVGIGFGSSVLISTDGDGTYSAQNLGSATYPWYSARFVDRVTSLAWTTTGRNYSNEWIEFPNASGLYSPINGAHFFPNTGSSYGAWAIQGTRNSYGGISFNGLSNGNVILMVYETSVETGFYNQANGWQFRWTSGTLYVGKGTYGGGTNAVVLDEVNFGSYALPLTGGTLTGILTLQYDYPRINLYDTNHDSDYSIINADGNFTIYDVTNNSNRLSIASNGAATFSSSVTATNFIVPGGTSAQFLKADGSLDSSVYLTATSSTFSYTASVTLSPTWQNTGVSSANLGTGAYLVTCNANDFGVGGGQYNCTYTGLMYFFAGGTNGSNANEIVLHHTGHADNDRYIYLRTLNTTSADGKTYLQISGNGTNSAASNYQLTFKKLL